ncbi:class A beta-lactamase [Streptomyces durbertensis]|uniref:Beta-lactamase n=1 Tax=Streptomyces durbertensis TaxID=2448886 RepID=A0ABR6EMY5_9ACTN|nr:class A beta-lactamase [Streptomyces durbertensis]MBB1246706.1 class A beta-lactamase [Streptomyces durbertensis]
MLIFGGGAGLGALAALAGGSGAAHAAGAPARARSDGEAVARGAAGVSRRLRALEREHDARIGVFAYDTGTRRRVLHRADERFPMCSVFKTFAAAAVLRDLDRDGDFLAERIRYSEQETEDSGYAPVTGRPENIARGMTVEELCGAAVSESDNAAANLLLRELGGPRSITRFCRSLGDDVTRLDRWEPELNSAEPWRVTDTSSPRAVGRSYARLVLGDALESADRRRLTDWLVANTTNTERFRAGLPADWVLGDKTGAGSYGTNNDAGIAWPPGRAPLVLVVLTTKFEPEAAPDNTLVRRTAELLAEELG